MKTIVSLAILIKYWNWDSKPKLKPKLKPKSKPKPLNFQHHLFL